MAKKQHKIINEADQLTSEEAALEKEMAEDDGVIVVVEESEATGQEVLAEVVEESDEEPAREPAKKAVKEVEEDTKVSIKALDSERHKRKEVEGRMAVLEEQLRRMNAPKEEEPAPPPEMPDPVLDIEGFKAWQQNHLDARMEPVRQLQQRQAESQTINTLQNYARSGEAQFTSEKPDYAEALAHAQAMKSRELSGYFPPEQIAAELGKVEASITLLAMQQGKNPAQIVYDYALMTGYQPGETVEPVEKVDAAGNITRLASAQRATQSTAGAGGSSRAEEHTIESLAAMSDEEIAEIPDAVLARVLGA